MVTSPTMFAIIKTGGKQYKVQEGDELSVELLELGESKTVKLDQVLLVSKDDAVTVGRPFVPGAYVQADLLKEFRGPKSFSFKYIRREKSATKKGHRQNYLKLKINKIHTGE